MKVKLLSPGAKVPTRAEKGAAGYDLYVPCNFVINPGRNLIKLDISIELKLAIIVTNRLKLLRNCPKPNVEKVDLGIPALSKLLTT